MGKIQTILWDLDGTLLDFGQAERHAIRSCFSVFKLGECTDAMLADYAEINRRHWERLERGELTKPEVFSGRFMEFFGKYGIDTSLISDFNLEYQNWLADGIFFYPDTMETLLALRGKVRQYVVTNGTLFVQTRKLERSGLNAVLDGAFISDEIGAEKPQTQFFDAAFDQIGVRERDSVMIVGDSLTSDMLGGNRAGIVCCWFNPVGNPKPSLRIDYEITRLSQVREIVEQ